MINKNISYYFNSSDSKSRIYYNFDHILELIASNPKLSKQTDMVRKQTTEKAYKEEKHRLPMRLSCHKSKGYHLPAIQ